MGKLINDINSSICNIEACIATIGANVAKSATYGRDEKELAYSKDLSILSLMKSRLERYRDTFLTDACYPATCSFDSCLNRWNVGCDDHVKADDFLTVDGGFLEVFRFSAYNPDRGTMVSMTGADDDGALPGDLKRVRFLEWDNCKNDYTPISGYIDVPDDDTTSYVYMPSDKRYYVMGDQWIVVLDEDFNVLSTNNYGGSRSWRGFDWDETTKKFYLVDNLNLTIEVLDYTTMTIDSTTSITPVTLLRPRDCVYNNGGVLILGHYQVYHFDPATTTLTELIFSGTDYYYGSPIVDSTGVVRSLRTDRVNNKLELLTWDLDSSTASISGSAVDLELSYKFTPATPSLAAHMTFDNCNNMVVSISTNLTGDEKITVYDKNFKKQDSWNSVTGYALGDRPYYSGWNLSNNKFFLRADFDPATMLIVDLEKRDGNKVDKYPEMCTPFTEEDICLLIKQADKFCSTCCK